MHGHDPDALDERLADVVRRLAGMRRVLAGADFEALAEALHVELDVAEMEAAARRRPRKPRPGAGNVIPFPAGPDGTGPRAKR
ncbi:hypothetical protein QO001_001431 [Methylobacterium brachiatum]|uniref:Uncharacterized protein n=1 Tax=Methylobacterium brachiatum TaxID=269660 RepID=A0AAJ1TQW9_9HYPH|nr:hypothetical protein [Methylobacterium brachiatum]MCB4802171.1 hypothetical protein [Methylobacterium brachiatum]MDQ0542513.1 hypothetical protein [Methylobacterium brachiatum]